MRGTKPTIPHDGQFRKQLAELRRHENELPDPSMARQRWREFVATVDGANSSAIPECGFLWAAGFATSGAGVLVAPRWIVSVRHLFALPAPFLISLPVESGLDIAPQNSFFLSEVVPAPNDTDLVLARLNRPPLVEDPTPLSVITEEEFEALTHVKVTAFGPDPDGEARPFKKQTPLCPIERGAEMPDTYPSSGYFAVRNASAGQQLIIATDSGGAVTAEVGGATRLVGLIVAEFDTDMAICVRLSAFTSWLGQAMNH